MVDSLGLTAPLFVGLCLCKSTYGYGFRFPRHYDQIVMGETVNITWDAINAFLSLHYVPTSIVGGRVNAPVVQIANNISNRGWALWEIPIDLSASFIGVAGYFMLTDGVTNDTLFDTEYVTVMATSTVPVPSPTLLGKFTAPTGAPNRSLKEGAAINFTWDTDAQLVNLSLWTAANDPWPIFSLTPNPGWYVWTVKDIAAYLLPRYLRLESNDTSYIASPTIDSEGFYVEPSNYPVATPNMDDMSFWARRVPRSWTDIRYMRYLRRNTLAHQRRQSKHGKFTKAKFMQPWLGLHGSIRHFCFLQPPHCLTD